MLELLRISSLPNLHPAVVHFPLALAPAAFLFDLIAIAVRRRLWLDRTGTALWVMAGLGALAAYLAGLNAEDHVAGSLAPRAEAVMYDHRDWALRALIIMGAAVFLRLLVAWRERGRGHVAVTPLRAVALLAGALTLVLLVVTADHGGSLVYHWGAAVTPVSTSGG